MASFFLLNDTMIVNNNQPIWVRAGDTISDAAVQSALLAAGGLLWPVTDAVMAAAVTIALKFRQQKGAEERFPMQFLLAAAIQSYQLGGVVIAEIPKTAADGAAATPLAETPQGLVGPNSSGPIGSVYFLPAASLAASDTNYATLQVQKRTAGAAPVTIAQATTQTTAQPTGTGSWTAWVAVQIPLVTPAPTFAALDAITYNIAKTGAGVVVPAGFLFVFSPSL
jgi:hypothetical protein